MVIFKSSFVLYCNSQEHRDFLITLYFAILLNLGYFITDCSVFVIELIYRVCRCVQDDQRSFALGIQWIKVRLIGTIPAPMVFGALIDETCILWQESCHEENGACLVYDNQYMGR
jgi:hypothetical protein